MNLWCKIQPASFKRQLPEIYCFFIVYGLTLPFLGRIYRMNRLIRRLNAVSPLFLRMAQFC